MYFVVEALQWEQFRQFWWIGPDIMVIEWIILELIYNFWHICAGKRHVSDRTSFGGQKEGKDVGRRRCCRWMINGILYKWMDSY